MDDGDRDTAGLERDATALRGAKVLLVEDNDINQLIVSELLNQTGLAVEVADNGRLAVQKIQAARFDIVLMDIEMPVMDGIAATQEIRRLGHSDLPILAMTGNVEEGDRERCMAAGMNDYLAKPIDPDTLRAALLRWIKPCATAVPSPSASETVPVPKPDVARIDPAIFDFDILGPIYGWDLGKLRGILAGFLNDTERKIATLDDAVTGSDAEPLRQIAHSLKGTARTAGAARLGVLAGDIEKAARDRHMDTARHLASQVAPTFKELRASLAPFLAATH